MTNKRVTVTVELLDGYGEREHVVWSHTETATHSTGDNPRSHWDDAQVALNVAGGHAVGAMLDRFGSVHADPVFEDIS